MDQAAHPNISSWHQTGFGAATLSALKSSTPATGPAATPPVDPVAVCALKYPKDVLIGGLREAIKKIERPALSSGRATGPLTQPWQLGCASIDRLLPAGLEACGVHEVKARPCTDGASAGDWMTSFAFALRLAIRRVELLKPAQTGGAAPWLLWCWTRALSAEFGTPSALGLVHLGLDPSRLLIVETARASEALVALEDGLKSSSLALAFGIFDEVALTPARRLSLASGASKTPCLLITHPASEPAGATSTRWRVGREVSADHPFDPRAPGNARFSLSLERCRARPASAAVAPVCVEWSDEARCFSVVAKVSNRTADARRARLRAAG